MIDQRYPFFAAGKSLVFQTKFGAWLRVSYVKCYHEEEDNTYNRLHDISKIISQCNRDCPLFCVGSADFIYPGKYKRTSSAL